MNRKEDILKKLPESQFKGIFPRLEAFIRESDRCIIVLDDDPTGCQTMYGIPVLFHWDLNILEREMQQGTPLFFLMTNSRSMTEDKAVVLYQEIGKLIREASDLSLIHISEPTRRH